MRAEREQKKLDDSWDSSYSRDEIKHKLDPVTEKRYTEWLEKEGRGDQGLLGQIILEEEDSDDFDI